MPTDSMRLVQALVGATSKEHIEKEGMIPRGPVVTVSRSYGARGKELAEALSARLGVRCFDKEILDAIVEDAKVHRYLMEELDERVRGVLSDWVNTLLSGKSVFAEDYRRHLVNVVVGIANQGGVIVGRGAHVVLADRPDVFRLRVVAPPEKCAERIVEREKVDFKRALERVEEVNREREQYIKALFKKNRAVEAHEFDLYINSGTYSTEQSVEICVGAIQAKGIEVK